jgi:hypothetical protein
MFDGISFFVLFTITCPSAIRASKCHLTNATRANNLACMVLTRARVLSCERSITVQRVDTDGIQVDLDIYNRQRFSKSSSTLEVGSDSARGRKQPVCQFSSNRFTFRRNVLCGVLVKVSVDLLVEDLVGIVDVRDIAIVVQSSLSLSHSLMPAVGTETSKQIHVWKCQYMSSGFKRYREANGHTLR